MTPTSLFGKKEALEIMEPQKTRSRLVHLIPLRHQHEQHPKSYPVVASQSRSCGNIHFEADTPIK